MRQQCREELLALIRKDRCVCVSHQNPHWQSWPCLLGTSSPAAALLPPPLSLLLLLSSLHRHPPSLSLSTRNTVRPFPPGPLVRLMDGSAASEWQCINYPAASLVLTWLSESSGSAEERFCYLLTWLGVNNTLRTLESWNQINFKNRFKLSLSWKMGVVVSGATLTGNCVTGCFRFCNLWHLGLVCVVINMYCD